MSTRLLLVFFTMFISISGISYAADVTLPPEDLMGKWIAGPEQDCGSSAVEYVIFRENETLEIGRGTKPNSVGFWGIEDNIISTNLLVAPGDSDTSNVFYRGRYTFSYVRAEILEASKNTIEIITGTTGNTKRSSLSKCE